MSAENIDCFQPLGTQNRPWFSASPIPRQLAIQRREADAHEFGRFLLVAAGVSKGAVEVVHLLFTQEILERFESGNTSKARHCGAFEIVRSQRGILTSALGGRHESRLITATGRNARGLRSACLD